MYRADLHCHSTCSDGMLSPVELLKIAKKKGLSGISITDHDTVNAYADEVYEKAKELKIDLLPGVEISSRYKNYPIHILGYAYKKSQYFLNFCAQYQKKRLERNSEI